MKIQVLHNYDNVETVDAVKLKRLIADKKILAFRRGNEWIRPDNDPVRGEGGCDYDGPERRNIIQQQLTKEQKDGMFRCILGTRGPTSDW